MPRVARNIISDMPYHVIHRGNNRQKIFFCDGDYRYFLSLIEEAKKKYRCRLHSYVLMPNHIHLLLESPQALENLADIYNNNPKTYFKERMEKLLGRRLDIRDRGRPKKDKKEKTKK